MKHRLKTDGSGNQEWMKPGSSIPCFPASSASRRDYSSVSNPWLQIIVTGFWRSSVLFGCN